VGVRFAQFYILGRLRNRTFFSLAEANAAIAQAVERMNNALMRRLGTSRRELFERIERLTLAALPADDYVFAQWQFARVGLDYHIEVEGFFYSVPFGLIGEQVDVRLTQRTLEAFHKGERVAAHSRRYGGQAHGTKPEHMPASHRHYASWSPERFRSWSASFGPNTEMLIGAILAARRHPEQGYRTCIGVLRHMRGLSKERVEAASAKALAIRAFSYKGIVSLLDARTSPEPASPERPAITHRNIRGPGYFH
jgi:transposase